MAERDKGNFGGHASRRTLVDIPSRSDSEKTAESDIERLSEFTDGMLNKWKAGREEHGPTMKRDPLEEAKLECLDLANYAMETYFRIKKLQEEINACIS